MSLGNVEGLLTEIAISRLSLITKFLSYFATKKIIHILLDKFSFKINVILNGLETFMSFNTIIS